MRENRPKNLITSNDLVRGAGTGGQLPFYQEGQGGQYCPLYFSMIVTKQTLANLKARLSKAESNQSNLSLYLLDYAKACNKLAGPISASLRPGNTAPFEVISQRWRAVGNTVSDFTGPRFEPQTSRSRDERVTAR